MPIEMSKQGSLREKTSRKLIRVFYWVSWIGFPLLGVFVITALVVPLRYEDSAEKVLTAKLTFTSLGLLFGVLQVFLGVLLALIGVTIDYDVDATVGPAKVRLISASPGILLLILGNALFAVSLMRQFDVTEAHREEGRASQSSSMQVPPLGDVNGPE